MRCADGSREGWRAVEPLVHRRSQAGRNGQGDRSSARLAGDRFNAAVYGVRCRWQDRGHDDLYECRCRQPPRRDRLDLVCQARAAQRSQYTVQIAAADACLREARLHCGRVSHPLFQSPEPSRHRTAGCPAGRYLAQPRDRTERHVARYRGLQHYRRRVADGEGTSQLSTQRKAAGVSSPRQKMV